MNAFWPGFSVIFRRVVRALAFPQPVFYAFSFPALYRQQISRLSGPAAALPGGSARRRRAGLLRCLCFYLCTMRLNSARRLWPAGQALFCAWL